MDKRYQVFISSTYEDLKAERDAVIKAVLEMGHFPVGMEMFNAADEEQWVTIQREIDRSDYYLLIVAHRYGSTIAAEGGISYTEKEFDYAVSKGVPRIGFEIARGASWDPAFVDDGKKKKRLDAFKAKVRTRPVDFWTSKDELAKAVVISLGKLIPNTSRPGWQRGTESTEEMGSALAELSKENLRLSREIELLRQSAQAIPQLKFFFTDEDGTPIGDTLRMDLADANAYRNRMSQSMMDIKQLLDQYHPQDSPLLGAPDPLAGEFPVKIPQERIDSVITKLNTLGFIGVPKFKFNNLYSYKDPVRFPSSQIPINGGLDYEQYVIFSKIERELMSMDRTAETHARVKNSFSYGIDCQNIGRVAAETVHVKIRAEANLLTPAGNAGQSNFSTDLDYDGGLDEIIPHQQIHIRDGRPLKSLTPGEVILHIRALGKNIPEPQEHQLKIVFEGSRPPTIVE